MEKEKGKDKERLFTPTEAFLNAHRSNVPNLTYFMYSGVKIEREKQYKEIEIKTIKNYKKLFNHVR